MEYEGARSDGDKKSSKSLSMVAYGCFSAPSFFVLHISTYVLYMCSFSCGTIQYGLVSATWHSLVAYVEYIRSMMSEYHDSPFIV